MRLSKPSAHFTSGFPLILASVHAEPGCLRRVLPSDETKLRSGLALRLEDSAIQHSSHRENYSVLKAKREVLT